MKSLYLGIVEKNVIQTDESSVAFALPLFIRIGCTFDPIDSLWSWWFWSLWCSICICTTFFISIVELGSSSFFYYNDRICPHWLYLWVPLTNLMVTGWTLENYRILSMLFLYLFPYCKLHLLSYALTVIQVKSLYLGIVKKNVTETVMKIVFPWYSPCGACYWRWLHLILVSTCVFQLYPIELPCLLWNQTLLVVFCEGTAEKGQTRVFIFLWVVWTDGKVWLTSHMTYQTCIYLTYSKLGSAHWLGWLWEHC